MGMSGSIAMILQPGVLWLGVF